MKTATMSKAANWHRAPEVLVVDDEADMREMLCDLIESAGLRATALRPNDQLEALYRLNKERAAEERAGTVRWLRQNRQRINGRTFESN